MTKQPVEVAPDRFIVGARQRISDGAVNDVLLGLVDNGLVSRDGPPTARMLARSAADRPDGTGVIRAPAAFLKRGRAREFPG